MTTEYTDRNLLFGVLALQADLIEPARFVEACSAWAARKDTPLAELLVERGWITAEDRADLERLIDRRLKKHDGDVRASLAGLVTTATVQEALAAVEDPDVRRSLDGLSRPAGHVLLSTIAYQPEGRGRYTVTHLHAKGGIGQVWMAQDTDLGRPVALKEVRPDRAGHPDVRARFLEEARITGQLEHPGIVPVYELVKGGGDSPPFYTMRFVRGRTLTAAAATYHRRRAAHEAGPLELRELLGAFVAVCNAVAYAHSRGVIHRDLKGRNVVLGDFGEVIVLDWGLAKVIGEPEGSKLPVAPGDETPHDQTKLGQVLGTPAYMPPEQAEGRLDRVDARSDVYGLGAMLYEILTGQPPFTGSDSETLLQRVIHEQPLRPRAVVATVPRALEAVCLKALAKAPDDRYPSATALADEVRHWLAGEPVTAYPEPWTARLRRWAGRNRTLVTATGAALLMAVVSLAVATALLADAYRETARARDQAVALRQEAEEQRDRARSNYQLARDAVEEYTSRVANDPRLKEKDLEALRQELLQDATKFFKKLTEQKGDDPGVRADLGRAFRDLAYLTSQTGKSKEAIGYGRQALALFEKLEAEQPADVAVKRELGKTYTELGSILGNTGDPAEAIALHRRAIRLLEEVRRKDEHEPNGRKYLAAAYGNLGSYLEERESKPEDITDAYANAVAVLEELADAFPDDLQYTLQLGIAYSDLGWRMQDTGNLKKGRELGEKAQRTLRRVLDKTPDDPRAVNNLGNSYHLLSRLEGELDNQEKAVAHLRKAVDIHTRLVAAHPSITTYQQGLARDLNNLALLLIHDANREEARSILTRARDLKEKLAERYPDVHQYRADLARTLQNETNFIGREQAEENLRRAGEILKALTAEQPTVVLYQSDLAGYYHIVGAFRERAGQWDEAVAAAREAIRLMAAVVEKNPAKLQYRRELAALHRGLAELYARRHRPEEAERSFCESVAVHEKLVELRPDNVRCRIDLGGQYCDFAAYLSTRKPPAPHAEEIYRLAITQLRAARDHDPANVRAQDYLSRSWLGLATLYGELGQKERAVETCLLGVTVRRQLLDVYPEAARYRAALAVWEFNLALLQEKASQGTEAAASLERAANLQEKLVAKHPRVASYRTSLAETYSQQALGLVWTHKFDAAIALVEKELSLRRTLVEQSPGSEGYLGGLARARRKLGEFRLLAKKPEEAAAEFQEALTITRTLLEVGTTAVPRWAAEHAEAGVGLGKALTARKQLGEAATALREASALLDRLDAGSAAAVRVQTGLLAAFCNLGESCRMARLVEEGADAYRRAQEIGAVVVALLPADEKQQQLLIGAHMNCGIMYAMNGRPDDALQAMRQASAVLDKLDPSLAAVRNARAGLAKNLTTLATILIGQKKPESATECYRLVVEQCKRQAALATAGDQQRRELVLAELQLARHCKKFGKANDALASFRAALPPLEQMARDRPEATGLAYLRGSTHVEIATLLYGSRRFQDALAESDRALTLLRDALDKEKNATLRDSEKRYLGLAHLARADALFRLERYKDALAAYDKGLELVTERNPARLKRALAVAHLGDHAAAVREAEAVAALDAVKPGELYDAACVLGLASVAAGQDKRLAEAERGPLAEKYAGRAVELLRRARDAGQFKRAGMLDHMKKDGDLEPLRGREDYRKLVGELEEMAKGTGK